MYNIVTKQHKCTLSQGAQQQWLHHNFCRVHFHISNIPFYYVVLFPSPVLISFYNCLHPCTLLQVFSSFLSPFLSILLAITC